MATVIFRNSDFRQYRIPFYDALIREHNVKFIFRFNKVPDKYNYISVREGYNSFWTDRKFLISYFKWLFGKYDIYIASLPTHWVSVLGLLISKLRLKKNIIWVEEWFFPDKNGLKKILKYYYKKFVYSLADAYFVTSTKSEEFVKKFTKVPKSEIFKALQANVDLAKFQPKTPEIFPPENHLIFLYFGRIIDWKGLDLLLSAFDKVKKKFNDITLLVVGEGPFNTYCMKLAKKNNIEDVFFYPGIDDNENNLKAGLFSLCDVFVLPSTVIKNQTEGWGLTVGEAMSMSKPVLVTDTVGCSTDLVINELNGFVVKHGSIEALAEGIEKFCKNRDRLADMGKNSKKIFESNISYQKMAVVLSKAINSLA